MSALTDLMVLQERIKEYLHGKPAVVLHGHRCGQEGHGLGEEIALFDTVEMANAFEAASRLATPALVDGWLRTYGPGILFEFNGLSGHVDGTSAKDRHMLAPALPWIDYTGLPRNPEPTR